jgi:isoleucyl-tRNA synthetase
MRWQYCAQPPNQNLLFGFGPAHETKRKLLTLWNSASFLVQYASIERFQPRYADLDEGPDCELRPLDRWLLARADRLVAEATQALEDQLTHRLVDAFEAYVDDLSNWYIRRSRRRFYAFDEAAFRTLWTGLAQALRVISPVMPFLSEHLWRNLVAGPCEDAPDSVFLAPWPEPRTADDALLAEVSEVRRVVELGRQARAASGLKLRQPLRRLVVQGAPRAEGHADEIGEELRVEQVEFGTVDAAELRVRPNLPLLGPKLGRDLAAVRDALAAGDFEELPDGRFRAAGHDLGTEEVLVERTGREGWAVAAGDGVTVALATGLDDELRRKGRVLDLVHELNRMRKEAGFELTDRIVVTLPAEHADLLEHADWIKREVLAVSIEVDGGAGRPAIARA